MGLDSVELVVEIEKLFNVSIPNRDAEKIYTVQDMVNAVAIQLGITNNSLRLKDDLLTHLNNVFLSSGCSPHPALLTEHISSYITPHTDSWNTLCRDLALNLPLPHSSRKGIGNKFFNVLTTLAGLPLPDWNTVTVDQFITAVCAHNHKSVIDVANITSSYEIYILVTAVTAHTQGLDYYEISPEKSFTKDLGID